MNNRTDPKEIYLEPLFTQLCPEEQDWYDVDGRQWCQDDVWSSCDYDGVSATKYIRADIAEGTMGIESHILKSNGAFSLVREPYDHNQHTNRQKGLDLYVDVLDHSTGAVNTVKLYSNTKGLHFKKKGNWYLSDFTLDYRYVPFQIKPAEDSA